MTKKKGTILALALTGVMIFGGTSGVCVSMAQTRQADTTTQMEQKASFVSEKTGDDLAVAKDQNWQEQESIYLPEGADLEHNEDGSYSIAYNDFDIVFYQGEGMVKESKDDLGLGKLIPIVEDTIKDYSGVDMEKCQMQIEMFDNFENEYEDFGLSKAYNYEPKYYEVCVFGIPQHEYLICVNSVTGEVLGFDHTDNSLDSFSNGWKMENEGDVCELSEEEQKDCDAAIEAFVRDDLKLGNIVETYDQICGLRYGENNERASYTAFCKTENGDVVEVMLDCQNKTVISFSINPVY